MVVLRLFNFRLEITNVLCMPGFEKSWLTFQVRDESGLRTNILWLVKNQCNTARSSMPQPCLLLCCSFHESHHSFDVMRPADHAQVPDSCSTRMFFPLPGPLFL